MNYQGMIKKSIVTIVCLTSMLVNAQRKIIVERNGGKNTHSNIFDALNAVSKIIKNDGYPKEGIEVVIKDGYYRIDKQIFIDKKFSGTIQKPFVIKAENPLKVHFLGGEILDFIDFKNFDSSEAGFELNDEKANSKIKVLDLKKTGIKSRDLGKFVKHGYGFERNPNFTTPAMLWVDGERMHLSRWPNIDELNPYYDNINQFKGRFKDVEIKGAVSMIDVIDEGLKKKNMWFNNNDFLENGGGTFTVGFDRGNTWNYHKDSKEKIWLDGVLSASWEWEYTQVKIIEDKKITLASGSNRGLGNFKKVTHFHFENVPEELDSSGEYFLDRENMLLYFYPPNDTKNKVITLATLDSDMIRMIGASNIKIEGIVLESGRGNAINILSQTQGKNVITLSNNIRIENCTIRNFNQWGVLVQGVHNATINNCHIYNLGGGGVKLGEDSKSFSLVKENNVVSNCNIHHIAFDQKSQVPGITLAGCGNIARNNEIYNTPHFAIKMKFANDCIAENNYMHNLPEYHHFDGGALYLATGGQFYNRGNEIKNNYFENITTNGAYLDNYTMGNVVKSNIFYNVGNSTKGSKNGAVYIHGGGQNLVENNIAINCPYAYKTGSHIVKAFNTTNYLALWYQDANEYFKPNSELYNQYVVKYPEMKMFLKKLHESPAVIKKHVKNNTLKAISSKKNRITQLDMYDYNGVNAFLTKDPQIRSWENWFKLRYQSTTFKNNIYTFTTNEYLPDFEGSAKSVKGAFKLGGESGVFEMSAYNLKGKGRTKKITNHIFEDNIWLEGLTTDIGKLLDSKQFIPNDLIHIKFLPNFEKIEFSKIGIQKAQ